jgi:hypothetical protein
MKDKKYRDQRKSRQDIIPNPIGIPRDARSSRFPFLVGMINQAANNRPIMMGGTRVR